MSPPKLAHARRPLLFCRAGSPRPADPKKGADRGIDGRLYFFDDDSKKAKQIVLSVKSGKPTVSQLRDLAGVVEREKAQIGVFISLEEPTRAMRREAASSGFYDSPWGTRHPRLQLLTIAQLLAGATIDRPPSRADATFKKAPRARPKRGEGQLDLRREETEQP